MELGGETKHPQRSVPWAVIGSVVIAGAIYLIVQVAFIGAIPHGDLTRGWHEVRFHGDFGPLAGLAGVVGLTAIAYLIYADAVISPAGSGMTFSATASRLPFALAREGYLPAWLGTLNRRGVPFRSLSLCFVAQVVVIFLLPDWGGLLSFITAATVLVYATAPLALGVLRRTAPDLPRPYRLRFARLTAPAAFVIANLLLIWVGWATNSRLFLVVAFGALIVGVLALVRPGSRHTGFEWLAASWIVPVCGGNVRRELPLPLWRWACHAVGLVVRRRCGGRQSRHLCPGPAPRHDGRSPSWPTSIDRSLGGTPWTCRWRIPRAKSCDRTGRERPVFRPGRPLT